MGDGERSLCLHAGIRSDSEVGDPGDPGELRGGGVVDRGALMGVASEDMTAEFKAAVQKHWTHTFPCCFLGRW